MVRKLKKTENNLKHALDPLVCWGWGQSGQGYVWGSWRSQGLALNFAQHLGGDGRVEVDGVVPQALGRLVAFATATLEGFPHADLGAVAVLGVVFDAVHVLVEGRKNGEKY